MTEPHLYYVMIHPDPGSPNAATSADFNPFRRRPVSGDDRFRRRPE